MGARGDAIGDKHALLKWIGEKLNELCGFTEANVNQFVLAIAEKHATSSSSSHKKLYETLKDSGFDAVTLEFSRELCNRLLNKSEDTINSIPKQKTKKDEEVREGKEKKKTSTNIAAAAYDKDEVDDEENKYALVQSSSSDEDVDEDSKRKSKKRSKEKKKSRKSLKKKMKREVFFLMILVSASC